MAAPEVVILTVAGASLSGWCSGMPMTHGGTLPQSYNAIRRCWLVAPSIVLACRRLGRCARRRIVRDLHDGAQQRLVHTVITLKLA